MFVTNRFTVSSACLAAAAAVFSLNTFAQDDPNVNFGLWETTATTTISSEQFSIPAETTSSTDCVTRKEFDEGIAFMEDDENCSVAEQDLRDDGADYRMVCTVEGMGQMTMTMKLVFGGDTMSGAIDGTIESPMGQMQMTVDMEGTRVGDCP